MVKLSLAEAASPSDHKDNAPCLSLCLSVQPITFSQFSFSQRIIYGATKLKYAQTVLDTARSLHKLYC